MCTKGERVDKNVLSRGDVDEIQKRIREQVFVATEVVRVHAEGSTPETVAKPRSR